MLAAGSLRTADRALQEFENFEAMARTVHIHTQTLYIYNGRMQSVFIKIGHKTSGSGVKCPAI